MNEFTILIIFHGIYISRTFCCSETSSCPVYLCFVCSCEWDMYIVQCTCLIYSLSVDKVLSLIVSKKIKHTKKVAEDDLKLNCFVQNSLQTSLRHQTATRLPCVKTSGCLVPRYQAALCWGTRQPCVHFVLIWHHQCKKVN